jgi:hypothetical protein
MVDGVLRIGTTEARHGRRRRYGLPLDELRRLGLMSVAPSYGMVMFGTVARELMPVFAMTSGRSDGAMLRGQVPLRSEISLRRLRLAGVAKHQIEKTMRFGCRAESNRTEKK